MFYFNSWSVRTIYKKSFGKCYVTDLFDSIELRVSDQGSY